MSRRLCVYGTSGTWVRPARKNVGRGYVPDGFRPRSFPAAWDVGGVAPTYSGSTIDTHSPPPSRFWSATALLTATRSDSAIFEASRTATSPLPVKPRARSEEHTSELQSLMRNSYAVFCLTNKIPHNIHHH